MSVKLISNIALGAAVGGLASVLIDKAQARQLAGKPAIPSGLLAAVSGLLPAINAGLKHVSSEIDVILDDVLQKQNEAAAAADEPA